MSATLIRSVYNVRPLHQHGVVTIGNFDGVHLGHQALLSTLTSRAEQLEAPSIVITFEPHPFEFFAGDTPTIPRLTRFREKFLALSDCGVDYVMILSFNHALANLSATDFLEKILQQVLRPRHVIVGDDFRFGRKREGDFALLQSYGEQAGFTVEALPALMFLGERASSTRVRKALMEGNCTLARALLGRPYTMLGRVRMGDQLGRQWGFPTANIYLHRRLTPVHGVYTVYMHGLSEESLPGVANIGIRPTVDGTRTLLEVHLLDFNRDIYGHEVRVEFCEKLRDEIRYPNIDLLKEQIAKDVLLAREYFKDKGKL